MRAARERTFSKSDRVRFVKEFHAKAQRGRKDAKKNFLGAYASAFAPLREIFLTLEPASSLHVSTHYSPAPARCKYPAARH